MTQPSVLIVEDDEVIRAVLEDALGAEGYAVTATDSALGALSLARLVGPDAILLDLGLPYRSGASLLAELKAHRETRDTPVIVLSGMAAVLTPPRRAQAAAVLEKPVGLEDLLGAVRAAVR